MVITQSRMFPELLHPTVADPDVQWQFPRWLAEKNQITETPRSQPETPQPIPPAEMREWVDSTVAQIATEAVDTVMINSVVQYFPSIDYLVEVLEQAVKVVTYHGFVFVGNVRSFPLQEVFHTSVQFEQALDQLSLTQLRKRVKNTMQLDSELVIDPDFFTRLGQRLPQVSQVQIQLKRGYQHNQTTKFCYDVIFHIDDKCPLVKPQMLDWQQNQITVSDVRQFLQATQPNYGVISNIPNARLCHDLNILELLNHNPEVVTVGELRSCLPPMTSALGIEPETWWALSERLPYTISINWSRDFLGYYNVVFQHK